MREFVGILLITAASLFPLLVTAEVEVRRSVVGAGGGETGGSAHRITGTVGQPVVGIVCGPANVHEIGFWYGPHGLVSAVERAQPGRLIDDHLEQNYPNPFNPSTTLAFSVAKPCRVTINIYGIEGRRVMTVVDADLDAGRYSRVIDANGLASGVYFCRMAAGEFVATRKLVLLK